MSTPPKTKRPGFWDDFDDHLRRHDYMQQHWERAGAPAAGGEFPTTPIKGTQARAKAGDSLDLAGDIWWQ